MSSLTNTLREKFRNPEYRHGYAESFLDSWIATQIRVLREQRGWSQSDLADQVGMKQSAIARLENLDYSGWSAATLKRLAAAFDVVPVLTFESFGSLLGRANAYGRSGLELPTFEDDPAFFVGNETVLGVLDEIRKSLLDPAMFEDIMVGVGGLSQLPGLDLRQGAQAWKDTVVYVRDDPFDAFTAVAPGSTTTTLFVEEPPARAVKSQSLAA